MTNLPGPERPDRDARDRVYDRLRVLPVGLYGTIDVEEVVGDDPVVGDPLDDLADIWADRRHGLDAHQAGDEQGAAWTWRLTFGTH